ncbi:MAG TPA: hypothetical protein VH593_20120, partial [Ktedonobacteraceae bacterium]
GIFPSSHQPKPSSDFQEAHDVLPTQHADQVTIGDYRHLIDISAYDQGQDVIQALLGCDLMSLFDWNHCTATGVCPTPHTGYGRTINMGSFVAMCLPS